MAMAVVEKAWIQATRERVMVSYSILHARHSGDGQMTGQDDGHRSFTSTSTSLGDLPLSLNDQRSAPKC